MNQLPGILIVFLCFAVFAAPESVPEGKKNKAESAAPTGVLITASAGEVGGEHITAREVLITSLIEDILYRKKTGGLSLKDIYRPAFIRETSAILLENAIWFESKGFPVASVSPEELGRQKRQFRELLQSSDSKKTWRSLQVQDRELEEALRRQLAAKKLLQFKVETASLPVTDEEATEYFQKNRLKYDKLPFENFRDSIKQFLSQKQINERLQEWFDVLKVKYRIDNQLVNRAN